MFENIDLLISGADTAYTVRVTNSPRDRTSSEATFPISDANALAFEGIVLPLVDQTQPTTSDLKPVGDALYRALLFDDRVQDIVNSTIAVAEARGSSARLRLQVEPLELRRLPWETLYHDPNGFLSLSNVSSITRFIAADGQPIRALLTQPPLKMLIVAASPKNLPPLDADAEIKRVRDALADAEKEGTVKIYERRNPSIGEVRSVLRKEGIHALHFIGHGSADYSDKPGDQPVLAFAGPAGEFVPISAEVFAANTSGAKGLRLVVLNACETAVESTAVPLLGVASKLIQRAGLPAVLAMQAAIRDDSAVAFAGAFYRELAAGGAIDDAVCEGRLAIFTLQEDKKAARDFIVPVLFLRDTNSEGRLVDFVAHQRERIVDSLNVGLEAAQNAAGGQNAVDWSTALTTLARTYTQLANWKTLHDILHELENVVELLAGELARLDAVPDLAPIFSVWTLAGVRLEQLRRLAADENTAIVTARYVEAADGSLQGEAWAVRVVVSARLIDSALTASDTASLPRYVRDLLQTLQTYMNVSDKALLELSQSLPLDQPGALPFASNGSPSKAAFRLQEARHEMLTLHAHLVERARLHDLLQDAGDAFRRVREEMRGAPSTWDVLDIDAAWRFCRAAVLDSRLRPYAEITAPRTNPTASVLSDQEWAVELFALAQRVDDALSTALSQQRPTLVAEPSRQFDAALRRTFFITDKSLQTITAELQTLARQLLILVA
ncbi:MAG: CHAT domain-containing protein [Burkholderiales bacterium]|nr:CHAT domain-containing protein [Anaerolineae bacterium]